MAQKLALGGASGVAAVLIFAGIVLSQTNTSVSMGNTAIFWGIVLLVIFGILGVFGILKRLF